MNRLLILLSFAFGSFFTISTPNGNAPTTTTRPDSEAATPRLQATNEGPRKPKNVILMIGDGMGLTQISAAMYSNSNTLHLERFPHTGLIKTHAHNNLITDSAAGGTAFSCGCKTNNGAVGMNKDHKRCKTILEEAAERGMATGLVATSGITHATPGAFIGHVPQRTMQQEIAAQFLDTPIDLFIGGGMKFFTQRSDGRNIYNELEQKNYFMSDYSQQSLENMTPSPVRPFAWFAAMDQPVSVKQGRTYLPYASAMAPKFLSQRQKNGFFLMIEGSQIDWGGHAKNADQTISETLDFDKSIGEVLKWAEQDGETLVIVTADHETGGMSIMQGSKMNDLVIKYNTDYHTATLIPVFAYGPGAERFDGMYDNTDIFHKIRSSLAWEVVMAK